MNSIPMTITVTPAQRAVLEACQSTNLSIKKLAKALIAVAEQDSKETPELTDEDIFELLGRHCQIDFDPAQSLSITLKSNPISILTAIRKIAKGEKVKAND